MVDLRLRTVADGRFRDCEGSVGVEVDGEREGGLVEWRGGAERTDYN